MKKDIWSDHTDFILRCMVSCDNYLQFDAVKRMVSNSREIMCNSGYRVRHVNLWQIAMFNKINEFKEKFKNK